LANVISIGGGLAGLTSAICLAEKGLSVKVIEKKAYPFHKVCGEYVSNEVLPFLEKRGLFPVDHQPSGISKLILSSPKGKIMSLPLDLGGFGISRYTFDYFLYQRALERGVEFITARVTDVKFLDNEFLIELSNGSMEKATIVLGAYGKRSTLDKNLNRPFFFKRSPYVAVKYHIMTDYPTDSIGLYNFKGGYCGISAIEDGKYCLCYLAERDSLRNAGSIAALEEDVLSVNPHLKSILRNSQKLYDKPEVINEVSFSSKGAVSSHILMAGDSAGMIAPLCGNGMAMAIRSGYLASGLITDYLTSHHDRSILEQRYIQSWNREFARRLYFGRNLQKLFGKPLVSELTIQTLSRVPLIAKSLVPLTHGKPFD
jgi:flavin-dependent dehydrogenase